MSENREKAHAVPLHILLGVWMALLFLTFVTYAVTWVDLGPLNIWIALGIASIKAFLVALFFMHLKWDRPFNAIVLVGAIFFLVLFLGLALLDTMHYQKDLIPGYAPGIEQSSGH